MPYRNPEDRREQQRRYRQTPQGREAHRRSVNAWRARQRALRSVEWKTNPEPLEHALAHWRH